MNSLLQIPPVGDTENLTLQTKREKGRNSPSLASELHVAIDADASYKIGTCDHCVLVERGRPTRAWDADGDKELDFDRDRYFAYLATFGIVMTQRQAYVCP